MVRAQKKVLSDFLTNVLHKANIFWFLFLQKKESGGILHWQWKCWFFAISLFYRVHRGADYFFIFSSYLVSGSFQKDSVQKRLTRKTEEKNFLYYFFIFFIIILFILYMTNKYAWKKLFTNTNYNKLNNIMRSIWKTVKNIKLQQLLNIFLKGPKKYYILFFGSY